MNDQLPVNQCALVLCLKVSISNEGHVWGVDASEKIWYRKGANNSFALGNNWKMIPGSLKQISVGQCGVWGVNSEQQVGFATVF